MFGYATDETEEAMPLTVVLAHKLNSKIAELRRNGSMAWARPDSKTQVVIHTRTPIHTHTQLYVFIMLNMCVLNWMYSVGIPCI